MPVKLAWSSRRAGRAETPSERLAALFEQFASRGRRVQIAQLPAFPGRTSTTCGRTDDRLAAGWSCRIATNIILPLINPVLLAEEIATLDWLKRQADAGRRARYVDHEVRSDTTPKADRVGRLWKRSKCCASSGPSALPVPDATTRWHVQIGIKPKLAGGPPILIGASAESAIKRAARLGDGWLITFAIDRETVAQKLALFRGERAAADLPMPQEQSIGRECYVGATMAAAVEEAAGPVLSRYANYHNAANTGLRKAAAEARLHARSVPAMRRSFAGDTRYRGTLGVVCSAPHGMGRTRQDRVQHQRLGGRGRDTLTARHR
jgi:alkanesulfonate monooxygenase SsuD/methylene tetrahydromethanopterin reductase-like flavin-dependent oxidoreductase (luciferase family)